MVFLSFESTVGVPVTVGRVGLARLVGDGQVEDLDVAQILAAQIHFGPPAERHVPDFPDMRAAVGVERHLNVHVVHLVLRDDRNGGCQRDKKGKDQAM